MGDGADFSTELSLRARPMAHRWADRVVRFYAAAAIELSGFAATAGALQAAPEIVDERSAAAARAIVNDALLSLLDERDKPTSERALTAALAAREALTIVAGTDADSRRSLTQLLHALHVASQLG